MDFVWMCKCCSVDELSPWLHTSPLTMPAPSLDAQATSFLHVSHRSLEQLESAAGGQSQLPFCHGEFAGPEGSRVHFGFQVSSERDIPQGEVWGFRWPFMQTIQSYDMVSKHFKKVVNSQQTSLQTDSKKLFRNVFTR